MKIINTNKTLLLLISMIFCCCSNEIGFYEFKDFSDGWKSSETVTFIINKTPDLEGDVFINLRNDNNYMYSNIFLITSLIKDGVEIRKDTLEYLMTDKKGKFLGNGFGNVKESILYWQEDYPFSSKSKYSLSMNHAVRKNGKQFGMKVLPGILSVGVSIIYKK